MYKIIWVAAILAICCYIGQAAVVKYTECPEECICEIQSGISYMSCKKMPKGNNNIDIRVIHFELTNSNKPFNISNRAFNNIALKHVNSITISNSTIIKIDNSAFSNLLQLSHVTIAYSNVTYIYPETFKNNIILRQLNLTGNPLKLDPFLVSDSIEEIDLSHCNINDLSVNTFSNLSQLTMLDLSHNNIDHLNNNVFTNLMDIQEIRLAHNNLKEIPENLFDKNTKLEVLDFSHNPLLQLPTFSLPDLQKLNLHACALKHITSDVFKGVDYLSNLDLSNNLISKIDVDAFKPLQELTSINLSRNKLSSELNFESNHKLEKIVLDNNEDIENYLSISFKENVKYFTIHYFSCNNCGLSSLPVNLLQAMPNLETLLLSGNKFTDISTGGFKYVPHLVVLDLSHNKIVTINDDTFTKNVALRKINLSGNSLISMHAGIFKNNTRLEYLDLSLCGLFKLWTLTPGDVHLYSLLSLNVSGNRFNIIDTTEICVAPNLKELDILNNPLMCTDQFQELIDYLQVQGVVNSGYRTHENQLDHVEVSENNLTSWEDIALEICPSEDSSSYYDDDETNSKMDIMEMEIIQNPKVELKESRNMYIWPVLVFFSTFLVVVALVVNTVLFIIQKRRSMARQSISIKTISRLKKNSGFVYQQLSEEHKQNTPIFGKFNLVATAPKANI